MTTFKQEGKLVTIKSDEGSVTTIPLQHMLDYVKVLSPGAREEVTRIPLDDHCVYVATLSVGRVHTGQYIFVHSGIGYLQSGDVSHEAPLTELEESAIKKVEETECTMSVNTGGLETLIGYVSEVVPYYDTGELSKYVDNKMTASVLPIKFARTLLTLMDDYCRSVHITTMAQAVLDKITTRLQG